ncbi:MAG TPA: VTT domain-containing protein [Candidatus Macondimonas sp.]|jgi:uncharacterized membrane protein YdjX (TVP38/TMEM64 family)|nr:VTT domain-containing protein [Candidatus Macondimonas sp.]
MAPPTNPHPGNKPAGQGRWWRRGAALLFITILVIAGLAIAQYTEAGQIRTALSWIRDSHAAIAPFGPFGFWLAGTLIIVANIPTIVVIACAAVLYGTLGAAVMGMACLLTASVFIYTLSRVFGRSLIARHLERFLPVLERHFAARGVRTVMLARLMFFALPPTNWALAVMNIRLREYLFGTFLGAIPHILMWAWIGASAIDMLAGQTAFSWSAPEVWGPLAVGGSLTVLTAVLQRRATRRAAA